MTDACAVAFRNFQVDLSEYGLKYLRNHAYREEDRLYIEYSVDFERVVIQYRGGSEVLVNSYSQHISWREKRRIKKLLKLL